MKTKSVPESPGNPGKGKSPSPWKTDRPVEIPDDLDGFKVSVTTREVEIIITLLQRMTKSPEHAFYLLLATMLYLAQQSDLSNEDLIEMLTDEITKHKVIQK